MLAVAFDRQRNVLLLTLLDTFDNGTLAVMDATCATFFDAEGPSHAIFDFTSTQKVVMAPLSLELAEKFRLHQSGAGLPAPLVVRTMSEAERLLGLGPLVFEPVDTSWLANDKAKVL